MTSVPELPVESSVIKISPATFLTCIFPVFCNLNYLFKTQDSPLATGMGRTGHKQYQARARDVLAGKAIAGGTGTGAGENMGSGTAGSNCCRTPSSRNGDEVLAPKACYSTMSITSNPLAKCGSLSPSSVNTM